MIEKHSHSRIEYMVKVGGRAGTLSPGTDSAAGQGDRLILQILTLSWAGGGGHLGGLGQEGESGVGTGWKSLVVESGDPLPSRDCVALLGGWGGGG